METSQVARVLTVAELLRLNEEQNLALGLELLSSQETLQQAITNEEIDRPGLPLAGFFECFEGGRILIMGKGEVAYIKKMEKENNTTTLEKLFHSKIPAVVITHGQTPPSSLKEICQRYQVPLLRTKLPTKQFIPMITSFLTDYFAPSISIHGNLVSVYGIGVLIVGKSGIGKSEVSLGLVDRGHKFIADDLVRIRRLSKAEGYELIGEPSLHLGAYLEIRGVGIINLSQYYGEGRIQKSEHVGLIIELHEWDSRYQYDRLGIDDRFERILEVDIPKRTIPVSSGRNIPLLIEIAAYREIMRRLGKNSAEELDQKLLGLLKK
ncbi:MAG: HPr(Ser) kinase/phosphatase [Brevinematales bacterium]|nr:HPr(Ser) kinase/phosphatase [Brevinematales bacterium]